MVEPIIGLIVGISLGVYLLYTLIRPEDFDPAKVGAQAITLDLSQGESCGDILTQLLFLTIMLAIGVLPVKAEPVHADPSREILILFLKIPELEGDAMTFVGWWQIAIVLALVVVTAIPVSSFIAERLCGQGQFPLAGSAAGRARLLSCWPASTRSASRAGSSTRSR